LAKKTGQKESFAGNDSAEPIFARALHGEPFGAQTYRSATDGIERIYHFKKLPSYPLLVLIGEATQDVFAEQEKTRVQRLREAAVLSVLLLALALLLSWSGTVRRRHSAVQRKALVQLQNLTNNVPGLVYQYLLRPDGSSCLPFASEGLRELFRLSPQQVAVDASPILALTHPDDLAGVSASIQASAQTLEPWVREYRVKFDDGTLRWLSGTAKPQRLPDGAVQWHGFIVDVTQRKAAEAEIEHLAYYDALTSLPNRRLLIDRLTQSLTARARSHYKGNGALLFVDIDNFKNLNDTQGHKQGDLLLQQVASRLNYCVREGDTVACLGGDDFVVMLQDLSDNLTEAASQAETVGQKILATLRQPYPLDHFTHHGSASVGVALSNPGHDTVEELLKRADLALYRAKDAGRNTLRFFDPEMQAAMNERAELEADLRLGLQEKQFLLYYQPQVDQNGRLTGVEALVRWQHPQRGMVSPADFIALAEDTRLILPLGQWVLETACRQLQQWATQAHTAHLTIAVNVSALQFHRESFVQDVLDTISRTGAPSKRLKLELTESLLANDIDDIIAKMLALKAQGVGFSLDDFGTGYSSLSYLKRLPLDQIKIDQSFVRDAAINTKDAALVRATVAMGHGLGMMVIAEGVETQAQRDFLESEGCYNYQGYLFGRPAPVQDLERFFSHE
jgi:diguanylate cyclase (GGDEF)-like protein